MKEGLIKGQFIIPGVIYLFILGLLNLSSSFYLCVSFNKKALQRNIHEILVKWIYLDENS